MLNNADLTRDLREFYEAYVEQFNRADAAGLNQSYDFPWSFVCNSKVMTVADEAAGLAFFEDVFAQLRARGWVRSTIENIEAYGTWKDGCTMIVGYRRLGATGETLEAGNACYLMRRADGRWKIATIVDSFNSQARQADAPPGRPL